jgi:serine/threonine protein kinase
MEDLVAEGRDADVDVALDGLAAFEAHHETVALLERCVPTLHGHLRNQGLQILERKRLSLNQATVAAHFERMGTQYKVEKALGQGPLTATYKAYRRDLDLTQVLRVLRPEFLGHPDVVARFLDLGRQSTKYVHQNLVLTRDVQTHPKERIHFIARDFVDGTTLQKLFAVGERISAAKTIRIIRRLLEALQSLHRDGEVHGSVKPSNIFITSQDRVILGDRGIPLQECPVAVDRMGYDFQYAAPEICTGEGRPGAAADFYSVGCVVYQLLCGRPPFESSNAFKLGSILRVLSVVQLPMPATPSYCDSSRRTPQRGSRPLTRRSPD